MNFWGRGHKAPPPLAPGAGSAGAPAPGCRVIGYRCAAGTRRGSGAVVVECPNLATLRRDLIDALQVPVFDIVLVAELLTNSLRLEDFANRYPHP